MSHWSFVLSATLVCVSSPAAFAQDATVPTTVAAAETTLVAPASSSPASGVVATAAEGTPDATVPPGAGLGEPPFAQSPAAAMPSVRSLFTDLRFDMRNAATVTNAVITVSGGAAAALIHPYDERITDYFSSSPALDTFLGPGKILGGTFVQFGGAWAAYGIGRAMGSQRAAIVGADLVRAQLVNTVFTQGLKLSVNRTRPNGEPWSFPSGHSSGTFANATVLQRHFGWKVGAPAYAFATYVAASRLQANKHFASDVIVGAALGIVSGRAVTVGRGENRFAIAPMGVRGGAGVSFTRVTN